MGDRTLVTYEYMAKNGPLAKMTYGNGDYVNYEYDVLGRLIETISNRREWHYVYGAEGELTRRERIGGDGNFIYAFFYEYDSLGRLIRSWKEEPKNGKVVRTIVTEHLYDASNRLVSQSWKSGTDERMEGYTYNSDDGTLTSMTTASGQMINYTYDYLKRLQGRSDGIRSIAYQYQDVGENGTSTQVKKISQTGFGEDGLELEYEYDAVGNIKRVIADGIVVAEYIYDNSYQLIEEKLPQHNVEYSYSYDTAGNIQSISTKENGVTTTTEYGYTDAGWIDLLTEYEYNAWGKILEVNGTAEIGELNPIRYRGYYFDIETGFYYVSSRYYDPEIGRFISADTTDVLDVQSDLYDKNLYAYCDNNPVMRADSGGEVWVTVGIMAVGGAIGGTISTLSSIATQYAFTGSVNWKSVGVAAISGIVGGAIAASPLGLAGQIGAGTAIGAMSYAADCGVNNRTPQYDEFVVSTVMGGMSGWIGGAGANQNMVLSNTIKTAKKTISKMSTRKCTSYAAKRIASTKTWRNNRIFTSTASSSVRFSAGTGVSNVVTGAWTKVKNWFSGLFK